MLTKRIRKTVSQKPVNVIIGLDPSLTGFGLSVFVNGDLETYKSWTDKKGLQKKNKHSLCYFKQTKSTESNRLNRTDLLFSWVKGYILKYYNAHVNGRPVNLYAAMEGYAFASQSSRGTSDTHELCGLIKYSLFKLGISVRIYDPLSIKLAWTGYGHATKEDMIDVAERTFGIDLDDEESAAENIADAILIGALLQVELEVKAGIRLLEDLDESFRKVLLRATNSEPEALVTRDMLHEKNVEAIEPITS